MKPTEKQTSARPIAELAALYGVSERTVGRWKRDGVDVSSPDAVEAHRATLQDRKPTGGDTKEIREKKLLAETRLKEAQADKAELSFALARGEVVSIPKLEETLLFLANRTKGQMARLERELPPRLEGLAASAMILLIREAVESILEELANDFDNAASPDGETTISSLCEGDTPPAENTD